MKKCRFCKKRYPGDGLVIQAVVLPFCSKECFDRKAEALEKLLEELDEPFHQDMRPLLQEGMLAAVPA